MISSVKGLYIIHNYLILGPKEIIYKDKNFDLFHFIDFLRQVWYMRLINHKYDSEDVLCKNYKDKTKVNEEIIDIHRFIVIYCELLLLKIYFHTKYKDLVIHNYNIVLNDDNLMKLIDKNFILDCLYLYSQFFIKFSELPLFTIFINNYK